MNTQHEPPEVPQQRAPVSWGCAERRTPPGQRCRHCADQGELFSRAETATTRIPYRRTR